MLIQFFTHKYLQWLTDAYNIVQLFVSIVYSLGPINLAVKIERLKMLNDCIGVFIILLIITPNKSSLIGCGIAY